MRILFVGMVNSIHTARWINQISNLGWKIYLYPVQWADPHQSLNNISILGGSFSRPKNLISRVRLIFWPNIFFLFDFLCSKISNKKINKYKKLGLNIIIRILNPDIIHSLEFQQAGYLSLSVKKELKNKFPTWIATNWGSDIYLFGRLPEHQELIQQILKNCDYYSCECERDVNLAKQLGLQGKILPVFPNTGGINLDSYLKLIQPGPVSKRKTIVLKGYQHWAGRALVAFQAFRYCIDEIRDYSISIISASEDVRIAAQLFSQDNEIHVKIIPPSNHEEILKLFGSSRIYIGLSISDGISTSLLEAMTMGAFPIQSCTACANEWIEDGKSGFIVPPEDPVEIARAIRIALKDNDLVDKASEINADTIKSRLDYSVIQEQVINMYQDIISKKWGTL